VTGIGWGKSIRGTRGRPPVKGVPLNDNARANSAILKSLTDCELHTGHTADQLREIQQAQREAMLRKARGEAA
jgi:hypothetical protein